MNESISLKMTIKPVAYTQYVGESFEGPCRTGSPENLTPEAQKKNARATFSMFLDHLKANLTPDAALLEPAFLAWQKNKPVPEEELRKLDGDSKDADLFLISIGWGWNAAAEIAKRYNKPVATMWNAFMGEGYPTCRIHIGRSFDLEEYRPVDFDDLNRLISLLAVKKAVRQSRILAVLTGGDNPALENLRSKYGIAYETIQAQEMFDEIDRADAEETQRITDGLIRNAHKVHMKREDIVPSVSFYVAARRLMQRYKCNAFSFPCYETCAMRIPAEKKFVPCLAHSLLKDEGFPSVCEGDVTMLPAMMLLMYISKKSAPMGNPFLVDKDKNIYALHHDVPGLKMKGLYEPDLSYEIRNFTFEGWGATIRRDYSLDKGQPVTIGAFNSAFTQFLLTKGEIVGCRGFDEVGCKLMAYVKVPDVVGLYRKAQRFDFCRHHAMVYGDHTHDLAELGELMGFEIVWA